MNDYFATTWSTSTITYGSVTALSTENIAENNRTLEVYANTQWEIRFSATDWTGGATVDIETVDCFKWDEDGVPATGTSLWIRNSVVTATGAWDNQGRMSATETPFTLNAYFHVDAVSNFDADTLYTLTLTVGVYPNV